MNINIVGVYNHLNSNILMTNMVEPMVRIGWMHEDRFNSFISNNINPQSNFNNIQNLFNQLGFVIDVANRIKMHFPFIQGDMSTYFEDKPENYCLQYRVRKV